VKRLFFTRVLLGPWPGTYSFNLSRFATSGHREDENTATSADVHITRVVLRDPSNPPLESIVLEPTIISDGCHVPVRRCAALAVLEGIAIRRGRLAG
jgi:hypothetical protein